MAEAVFEITLPRHSGDILPKTDAGNVLAIADRFSVSYLSLMLSIPFKSKWHLNHAVASMLQTG